MKAGRGRYEAAGRNVPGMNGIGHEPPIGAGAARCHERALRPATILGQAGWEWTGSEKDLVSGLLGASLANCFPDARGQKLVNRDGGLATGAHGQNHGCAAGDNIAAGKDAVL